jgi:hypothetical protein
LLVNLAAFVGEFGDILFDHPRTIERRLQLIAAGFECLLDILSRRGRAEGRRRCGRPGSCRLGDRGRAKAGDCANGNDSGDRAPPLSNQFSDNPRQISCRPPCLTTTDPRKTRPFLGVGLAAVPSGIERQPERIAICRMPDPTLSCTEPLILT